MKYKIFTALALAGSALAELFGGWDQALQTLVIFMAVDWITGGILLPAVFRKSPKSPNGALESRADGNAPSGSSTERDRCFKVNIGKRGERLWQALRNFLPLQRARPGIRKKPAMLVWMISMKTPDTGITQNIPET